jgi:acyl carrier protein
VDLHQRLESVFREVFNDDSLELSETTTAADIPGWDSLAHINLMLSVENTFGVHFTDAQLGGFATVGELEHFLATNTAR